MAQRLQQLAQRVGSADQAHILAVVICTLLLALGGPATAAFARAATVCESESQAPGTGAELVEHATPLRTCERTHFHRMRREHHAPTGSCASAPESRGAGFSRHWSPRALDDARRAHNGFGGPLIS